jgi:hypothetical protein
MCPAMKNKLLNFIPLVTIYLLLLAVPVGLIIAVLLQKVNFFLNGLILGLPIIAAVLVVLKIHKTESEFTEECVLFPSSQQSLTKLFLIIFTLSSIVLLIGAIKSPLFLVLIVFLYCIMLIQIFSKNPSSGVIITETIATLIIFIYSTTLTSGYYFGFTDIIPHVAMATITSSTGHIISSNITDYFYFPLYHIWIAANSIITGLNTYTTVILLTCPVYAISVIFIYFLFYRIIKNQQIALLTCLLYSLSSVVVFYGTYVVTRTMASLGFLILLYLLYNYNVTGLNERRLIYRIFAILFSVYIILVHQVSTPMILMLLVILIVSEWLVSQQKYISTSFTVLLLSIFIGYWIFCSYSFTSNLIITRLNFESLSNPSLIISPFQNAPLLDAYIFLINSADRLILLFFGIIGILYVIWKEKISYSYVFGLFALSTIILYIPSPLLTLWQTVTLLRFDRFQLLIIPFLVLIMAWGFWAALKYFTRKNILKKAISGIFLFIFILYCCSSVGIIHYETNPTFRLSFNTDEIISMDLIIQKIPSDSLVFSDYFTNRYLYSHIDNEANLNPTNIAIKNGYFLIPKKQFLSQGLLLSSGSELTSEGGTYPYISTDENIHTLFTGLAVKNHLYSSNVYELYYN